MEVESTGSAGASRPSQLALAGLGLSRRKVLSAFGFAFVSLLLYVLFWPVEISPVAWTPPEAPTLRGQYERNTRLASTERLPLGSGFAPEDVALDSQGRIYTGLDDGRIIRLQPDGSTPRLFVNTGGRPLGMVFDHFGHLIVADAIKGLVSITPEGRLLTLATEADGIPFRCVNDVDVGEDGTIYFTDASSKFPLRKFKADILEHQPNGRLLAFDPKTARVRTILPRLHFANGVAVSPDQSFVLVCETGSYCVWRIWLRGEKQGQSELFIDNLPGFPDGISASGHDRFWLALVTPRELILDKLLHYPTLRKVLLRLPEVMLPTPKRYAFVLGLDANGRVVENLQDGSLECYAEIANVVENNGLLYFGSIGESTIGRFRLR